MHADFVARIGCLVYVIQVKKLDTIGNSAVKCTEVAYRCRMLQILLAGLSYPKLPQLTGPADIPTVKAVSIVFAPAESCGQCFCVLLCLHSCVVSAVCLLCLVNVVVCLEKHVCWCAHSLIARCRTQRHLSWQCCFCLCTSTDAEGTCGQPQSFSLPVLQRKRA